MQSAATVVVVAMTAGGVVLVNKAQNLYSLSHGAHWANNCRFGTRGGVHLYILGGYDASCMQIIILLLTWLGMFCVSDGDIAQ